MSSPKVFNTLQARYDNQVPDTPSKREDLHADIVKEVSKVLDLLDLVDSAIYKVHRLAEGSEWEGQLDYLMYQLDIDTAKQECITFLTGAYNNE